MALNTFAALCVTMYYVGITTLGVWSGRKLHIGQRTGRRGSRLSSRAQDDADSFLLRYFLCDRRMPLLLGFSSMTATWVGGGYLNGTAEAVYRFGLIRCQAPFGYAISLILGGAYFVSKLRQTDALTMLDPFQRRYGKWVSLLLLPPAVCGELFWTAAVLSALGSTVEVIVQLDARMAIVVSAAVTFFYTSLGGLYSVTHTDSFQAAGITIGLWACVPFCLGNKAVGLAPYPDNEWRGEIHMADIGQIVDEFATTVLGGIPWQVRVFLLLFIPSM
ncbi:high-affinity choline transporter 1-like [Amblyomma americanum]